MSFIFLSFYSLPYAHATMHHQPRSRQRATTAQPLAQGLLKMIYIIDDFVFLFPLSLCFFLSSFLFFSPRSPVPRSCSPFRLYYCYYIIFSFSLIIPPSPFLAPAIPLSRRFTLPFAPINIFVTPPFLSLFPQPPLPRFAIINYRSRREHHADGEDT